MAGLNFTINTLCDPSNASHFISNTIFQRFIEAKNISNKSMDIEVKVTWTDEKGTHETYTISAISNW